MASFLLQFEVTQGDTSIPFYIIEDYDSEEEAQEMNEVEHDSLGLDLDNTPIGGAIGICRTELCSVKEVPYKDYKVLRKYLNL